MLFVHDAVSEDSRAGVCLVELFGDGRRGALAVTSAVAASGHQTRLLRRLGRHELLRPAAL